MGIFPNVLRRKLKSHRNYIPLLFHNTNEVAKHITLKLAIVVLDLYYDHLISN